MTSLTDDDMDSDTATESDLALKSRSFLNRVNDRLRNMLDQFSKDATQDSNKHSLICGMFVFDIGSICIHGHQQYRERSHFEEDV